MPAKKKKIKPQKPFCEWVKRDTEDLFNEDKFFSDVRRSCLNSKLSLSKIGAQMGIGRMAMSRLFNKSSKVYVNDFLVICHYLQLNPSDYYIEF